MNKKILVTGGAGFVGSNLIRMLIKKGYRVSVLDNLSTGLAENLPRSKNIRLVTGDMRDFELVSTVMRGHESVIHLAAQPFIPVSYQLPIQIAEVNAIGSINVFKACLDNGVNRLVHVSSSEVYGSAQYTPMDEQHPLCPYSTYAVAKAAADMFGQTFYLEHKLPVVILRPFNIFGPYDSLPRFIPEMIRHCMKEPKIHVGNLDASRDFTYAEDAVNAMISALEIEDIEGEIINIGTNKSWKMKNVLNLIMKEMNVETKEIVIDRSRYRPKDVMLLITNNSKAKRVLGWEPKIKFEEGIEKLIKWYVDNGKMWGYEKYGWLWRY